LLLTPEEQDIYKKLQDKVNRVSEKNETTEKKKTLEQDLITWYKQNMQALQSFL
jgi:hypothetical protein